MDLLTKNSVSELTFRKRFSHHLSAALTAAIFVRVLALVLIKILSTLLPRDDFASYSLWMSLITLLAVTSTSSPSATLWRFMETRRNEGSSYASKLISTSITTSLMILVLGIGFLLLAFLLFGFQIAQGSYYIVSLLIAGFLSSGLLLRELILVVSGTEQNSREIVAFNMSFSFLATMCAALFAIYFLDASAVLLGLGLGYFVPLLIALGLQLKRYGLSMPSLADFRVIVRFGGPNMVAASSLTAIPFIASYLTMVMVGLSDVATLAIAITISSIVSP